jgi:hypothetical protein
MNQLRVDGQGLTMVAMKISLFVEISDTKVAKKRVHLCCSLDSKQSWGQNRRSDWFFHLWGPAWLVCGLYHGGYRSCYSLQLLGNLPLMGELTRAGFCFQESA